MQHEPLMRVPLDRVQPLDIFGGAERRRDQSLCFPPGKQRGTMRPGKETRLATHGTDFVLSPVVRTTVVFQKVFPENSLLHRV